MVTICITIPHEIKTKLDKIDNKSGLIAILLKKHFDNNEDVGILKIRKDKLIKETETKIKEIEYQIEIVRKKTEQEIVETKVRDEHKQRTNELKEMLQEEVNKQNDNN